MKRFSERLGIRKPTRSLQVKSMDSDLRNSLWNVLTQFFGESDQSNWERASWVIAREFLKIPTDDVPFFLQCRSWMRGHFFRLEWYQVYDLIEIIACKINDIVTLQGDLRPRVKREFNLVLEREMSAYRFLVDALTPISSPTEVEEIKLALRVADRSGHVGASPAHTPKITLDNLPRLQ